VSGWLIIALVFAVLVVFWQLLELTFDLIEKASAGRSSREAMSPDRERE
jgi:hypothetical protein